MQNFTIRKERGTKWMRVDSVFGARTRTFGIHRHNYNLTDVFGVDRNANHSQFYEWDFFSLAIYVSKEVNVQSLSECTYSFVFSFTSDRCNSLK